ncbi:MAG: B12-binding domain-containing radical SAM protein [Spirochaetia bacterium]|jgi:radical SAM superfamily enzyme YgiQ (UPF0313 family)|nr:B12-binding domain-containing radical SAM protein [Spirochaetia bacterium]
MKIVFIVPTTTLRRTKIYRLAGLAYGHSNSITGPLILGGILKRAGYEVEDYEELNGSVPYKQLLKDTDIFCLYTMTSTAPRAYELADMIHKNSSARVLIGGYHASALPNEAAEHADQVIVGEAENVIVDVVEGRLTEKIVQGKPSADLDDNPFPDYSVLKTPCQAANVLTTRGCPFSCTFCSSSRMFRPYRQRSVDNVIKEIRMYKEMGFKYINFEDDNFTADKERAKEICRRMIKENLMFREIFFFGRTDLARDEELLQLLHDAHLSRVLIGIESLNQKALDSINKRQNVEDIKNAAAACKKYKIRLIASIVLGLDEDSREDIRKSVDFTKSIDAYQLQPALLTPYPGTPVFDQMTQQKRIIFKEWNYFDMFNTTFLPMNLTPWELQKEFYHAAKVFYDRASAVRIGKIFGKEYEYRRLALMVLIRLGLHAVEFTSKHVKKSLFYQLRHFYPYTYAQLLKQPKKVIIAS